SPRVGAGDVGPGRWIAAVKDHLLEKVLDGELGRYNKEAATEEALRFVAQLPSPAAVGEGEGEGTLHGG
ncbi:MAG TPA: hypothetical protein VF157_05355, partial [Chloroflexota bacterium]